MHARPDSIDTLSYKYPRSIYLFRVLFETKETSSCPRDSPPLPKTPQFLALAPPRARLSLISRHLEQRPLLEINTPFSTERQAGIQDDLEYSPIQRDRPKSAPPEDQQVNMSGQAEHPALMIPGPIEFDDAVLLSMGHFRCARCPALAIALY